MNLKEAFAGVEYLGLDTPPVIYFIERHPRYIEIVREIMRQIDNGAFRAVTSVLTISEVLAVPLRTGDDVLTEQYRSLLSGSRNLHTTVVDVAIAERAAELRARHGLRTPDAIQVAAALAHGCDAFLTNDGHFRRITGLRVLILDELTA